MSNSLLSEGRQPFVIPGGTPVILYQTLSVLINPRRHMGGGSTTSFFLKWPPKRLTVVVKFGIANGTSFAQLLAIFFLTGSGQVRELLTSYTSNNLRPIFTEIAFSATQLAAIALTGMET